MFFQIDENEEGPESWLESENKVLSFVNDVILKKTDVRCTANQIARAHRLGKYSDSKTRPIIVKFENHKMRKAILECTMEYNKGRKENRLAVSEDFCKNTQATRKALLLKLKLAKEVNTDIEGGFLKYKTLIVIYGKDQSEFRRSFTLDYVNNNPKWYIPNNNN